MSTLTREAVETVSRDEMLQRAARLVPVLAARAQQAEQLRRIPDETVGDLVKAGLLRIANPDRFGGFGLDYDTVLEVGAELGRGCGSTAWCFTVWSSHNWLMGHYPAPAQEEYFAGSGEVLSSSGFSAARAKVEPADGGFLLSGRWDFSSGCDAATWALLGAFLPDRGPGLALVPRSAYQIDDTWFASGMKGTGSKDIVISQPTHVPWHRFLAYGAMATGETPGRALHSRLTYRLPAWSVMPFTLACPLLGIAQGAVDAFEARTRTRLTALTAQPMVNLTNMHARLAEAAVEVDCARHLMRHDLAEMIDRARRGEAVTLLDRARYRRDHAYIAKLSVQAVNRVFEVSGGHALFESSPIQRAHRDVHAGAHQVALTWDTCAEQYGRVRFGLEPTDIIL
jgi:alkylation response protein AidB-like acyl-CoA dehydrogenase